jgi:hypothetical protein
MSLELPIRIQELARADPDERCELCSAAIPSRHQHLVEPAARRMLCSCRACALLFCRDADTKFRLVPEAVVALPELVVPEELWARLIMPVRLVFFFYSTPDQRIVGLYPSPAGPTEAQFDQEAWRDLVELEPSIAELLPDVQALLINRLENHCESFIAPLDRCYELVGRIRQSWSGMTGGTEMWHQVAQFFAELRQEARPL